MAALSKRDIDLIFRAEDRGAGRTAKQLRKDIRDLRSEIQDQAAAAERGEGSNDKLRQSYRGLKDAVNALKDQQSLIKTYADLTEKQAAAAAKTEELRQRQQELQAEFTQADKPTKALTKSLESIERRIAKAADAEEVLANKTQIAADRLQLAGIEAKDWASAQNDIVSATKEAASALALNGQALNNYDANLERAKQSARELAEAQRFEDLAAGSGLPIEQLVYISDFENRIEMLNQAMAEAGAQKANFDRAVEAQGAIEGAQRVRALETALDQAQAAQQRLETAQKFQAIASNARAAALDVDRFGTSSQEAGGKAGNFADAIFRITDPARAAATTIKGVEEAAERAGAVLDNKKASAREYQDAVNDLSQAQAGLNSLARDIDGFQQQEAAAQRAKTAFDQAQAEVLELASALSAADEPTEEMARQLRQAEGALERAGNEMVQQRTKADKLAAGLRGAGVATDNLEDEQRRLAATAKRTGATMQGLQGKLRGNGAFLGLKPYELQNLGFQINDIFTSLASGQRPLQVLAQQGGQLAQIPGVLRAIATRLPILAALAAAIALVASVLKRANDRTEALRNVERVMIEVGDSSAYTKEGLLEATDAFQQMGFSAEEARYLVAQFARDGLDPEQFEDFATVAQNVAEAYPDFAENAVEATAKLTDAFDEGKDGVLDLDNELHFLTDTQREQIEAMSDAEFAARGNEMAFDALYGRSQDLASQFGSALDPAMQNLRNSWNDFLDSLGVGDPWEAVIGWIADVIDGLAEMVGWIGDVIKGLENLGQRRARLREEGGFGAVFNDIYENGLFGGEVDAAIDAGRDRRAERRGNGVRERDRSSTGGINFNRRTTPDRPSSRSNRGSRTSPEQREAERRQREIESSTEQLQRALESLEARVARGSIIPLEQRFAAIDQQYARLERQIDEFEALAGSDAQINGLSLAEYRERLDLAKQSLREQTQLKFEEEQINDELERRQTLLEQIEDDYERGSITAAQAAERAGGVLEESDTRLRSMTANALEFARALFAVRPSPELERFIARLEGLSADANRPPGQDDASVFNASLYAEEERELNRIIAERNERVRIANDLHAAGAISHVEQQRRIQEAYEQSNILIDEQVETMIELLEALGPEGLGVSVQAFQNMIDRLRAVQAEGRNVHGVMQQIRTSVTENLSTGAMDAFSAIGQGIAGIIDGTQSVGDAFANLGRSVLASLAKILLGIAETIIQALILKAILSAVGLSPGAVGGGGDGGLLGNNGFRAGLLGIGGSVLHEGGIAGSSSNPTRRISAAWFANAPRYHGGGIAGLRPGEVPAILEAGEEVLDTSDPRHIANQAGGGERSLKIINTFDTEEVVAEGLATQTGERAVLNVIRKNPNVVRQALG